MATERFIKKTFPKEESILFIDTLLSRMWGSGFKIFLVNLGNLSRGEYKALAKKFETPLLATRSIFGGWLGFISWVIPGSYVGALEVRGDSKAWAEKVIDLAGEGYVVLVIGKDVGIEGKVANAIQSYSVSRKSHQFYSQFPKCNICVVNAEDQSCVEVETDVIDSN